MIDVKLIKEVSSTMSVLYAEDDRDIAKTIINYLSKLFNEVVYAENGVEALTLYKQNSFDVVITDVNMPEMTGLELTEEIKKINNEQNVIIVSAYSDPENFMSSIKLGVDGYIIKPVNYNEMNELLYKVCSKIKKFYENDINVEQQKFLMEHISQKNLLLRQYTDVIDKVAIVSKTDLSGTITHVNDFFCEVSGYSKDELIGQKHNIVRHSDMAQSVYEELWKKIQAGEIWEGTIKNRAKDGSDYYVHTTVFPMMDKDNKINEYMAIRFLTTKEETEKREFKKKVRSTYQEYRKSTIEANQKIETLSKQLNSKIQGDSFKDETINDLRKKLKKANSQIKFYEDQLDKLEERDHGKFGMYNKKLDEATDKYKQKTKEFDTIVKELFKLREDNVNKQHEIIKLNNEIIDQREIIVDLRDTIKNIKDKR